MKKAANTFEIVLSYIPKCFRKSGKYRVKLKKYFLRRSYRNAILAMTLLVKDEEKIIEQNIRFHKAMGVDVFIVTVHNSTDKTESIIRKLQAEGFNIELIVVNEPGHFQDERVHKMIGIAKTKYKADWVINADADEFYYSKDFNLKRSIYKYRVGNVIKVDSTFSFPNGEQKSLLCPYFIKNYIPKFWYSLGTNYPTEGRFVDKCSCSKVIHTTKNYVQIGVGNHFVIMKHKKMYTTTDIILYHFTDGSYSDFLEKVKRYKNSFLNWSDTTTGAHIRYAVKLYEEGKLKEFYDSQYSPELLKKLIEIGIVAKDYSLINYLKYKEII